MKKALLSFCLVLSFIFSGCTASQKDEFDTNILETMALTEDDTVITTEKVSDTETIKEEIETCPDMPDANGITYFTFDLFGELTEEENLLVSPLSALSVVAMVGNGANGETLSEIESALGYEIRNANKLLCAYLQTDSEEGKLSWSNSLWCNESALFVPYETYTDTLRQSYNADIYSLPFDDSAVLLINDWVNEKTDGMIDNVIDEINPDTALYAINTLLFDADWSRKYSESDISEGEFYSENGEVTNTEFMTSTEFRYLVSDKARGFIKYYEGKRFVFIGLLPNEGMSIEEYRKSLTAFTFNEMIENVVMCGVSVTMPKFVVEYENELSDELIALGMKKAFDPKTAEFSKLGATSENIYINQVIHKTKIEVGELGTKAGAVTALDAPTSSEIMITITLNRPFVYVIYDFENEVPLFIGTLTNP